MTQTLAQIAPTAAGQFSREQVDLIKQTVAKDTSDLELQFFLEVCKSSGLNPFHRQIYAIVRQGKMTIQTGIDGYRLMAARTGQHIGTSDVEYGPEDDKGKPTWARVTVSRFTLSGHVAEFTATARWSEYMQTSPTWTKMPFLMLGKCAESLALRKAFPAELSGIYTADEMAQADSSEMVDAVSTPAPVDPSSRRMNQNQRNQLTARLEALAVKDVAGFIVWALNDTEATLENITIANAARVLEEAKAQLEALSKEAQATEAEFAPAV